MMFFLRREIRRINRRLGEIMRTDTNALLTTAASDRDAAALAASINALLESNRNNLLERTRAETALNRAVTNISHDLRTPLTAALGYLHMLESQQPDAKTQARYLQIAIERLKTLSVLMQDLFEFSRIIEGSAVFDIRPVNVGNILRDTLSLGYAELEESGFTVSVNIPDTPNMCLCDEDALRRVLQNLIKNVLVHGKDYMRVCLENGVIEIANKADDLKNLNTEQIFERFYTKDASRQSKNTGLGLAIAKELILCMGGKISALAAEDMLVMRVWLPVSDMPFPVQTNR